MARKSNSTNSVTVVNENDTEKVFKHKIGLVFDGGGAKGAYQIGVWRALREAGLEQYVTDVAGTSVGGLNAALFVKGDLDKALEVWTQKCSSINWTRIGMCLTPLIREYLGNMSFFSSSSINCFLTVTNVDTNNPPEIIVETPEGKSVAKYTVDDAEYINMRFLNSTERKNAMEEATVNEKVLLATSALPVLCRSIKLNGREYRDGGLVDNSPVFPLLEATQCDTIIVIHLDPDAKRKKGKNNNGESLFEYDGVSVLDIFPSMDTGHHLGTIDFDNDNAEQLINLGYNDTKALFEKIIKNWAKETLIAESGEKVYEIIDHLSLEDKYRLYNECEFLVRGNYAKLNYLSEDGFGKTILRVITGGGIKAKKQILENTVALQEKMMGILVCLDDEMHNMKLGMHYLFYRSLSISDILLAEHREYLRVHDILDKLIKNAEYTGKFLSERYSEYKQMDMSGLKKQLSEITAGINVRIEMVNEMNRKALEIHEAQIEVAAKRISDAKAMSVIRFTPKEIFVISSNGIEVLPNNGDAFWNKVDEKSIAQFIENTQHSAIILPQGNRHPHVKTIRPADYYMYLWFINTPMSERAGQCVCMIDYFDTKMYVYGYEVSADGKTYKSIPIIGDRDNDINRSSQPKELRNKLIDKFGICYMGKFQFFRTFSTTSSPKNGFESRLNNTEFFTINKVDPNWENALKKNDGELFVDFVDKFINKVYE